MRPALAIAVVLLLGGIFWLGTRPSPVEPLPALPRPSKALTLQSIRMPGRAAVIQAMADAGAEPVDAAFSELETLHDTYRATGCMTKPTDACVGQLKTLMVGYGRFAHHTDVGLQVAGLTRLGDVFLEAHASPESMRIEDQTLPSARRAYENALKVAGAHGVVSRFTNDARAGLARVEALEHSPSLPPDQAAQAEHEAQLMERDARETARRFRAQPDAQ